MSNTEGQPHVFLKNNGVEENSDYSVSTNTLDNGETKYSISFLNDLNDGIYHIITEDDAGNQSEINEKNTITIDSKAPELGSLFMEEVYDTGISKTDLLSNLTKPIIIFLILKLVLMYHCIKIL